MRRSLAQQFARFHLPSRTSSSAVFSRKLSVERSAFVLLALITLLIVSPSPAQTTANEPDSADKTERPRAVIKEGDIVTFVDENGQKLVRTVEKIQSKIKPTADETKKTADELAKEPRTAGSDETGNRDSEPASEKKFRELSTTFAVPDSPAAHVLGVASEQVIHAETPKQLVAALINGLDQHGNLQNGFAVDFAPVQLYLGKKGKDGPSVADYAGTNATKYLLRVLGRTQLSVAAIRGTSDDDKSGKIALGLHTTLLDAKDPAFLAGFTGHVGPELESLTGPSVPNDMRPFRNAFLDFLFNHASWSIGAAPSWIAEDAERGGYEWNGLTAWSTFTISLKPEANDWMWPMDFLVHVRYRSDEKIPIADALPLERGIVADPSEMFANQDSLLGVAGLRFGRKDFFVTGTATYTNLRQNKRGNDDTFRYSVALEKKISSNTWLSLSVGTETGGKNEDKPLLVLAGVKLGLDGKSFGER